LKSCGNELIHKEMTAIGRIMAWETGTCAPGQVDLGKSACMAKNAEGREIPRWFTFRKVATELKRSYVPRHCQGLTVFFTSLSGAGKSTIANVLMVKLLEVSGRPVTLLDGDIVCKHLSSELGFSKEHRNLNVYRIGFVAAEITKNSGIAICASISPSIAFVKTCAPWSSRPRDLCWSTWQPRARSVNSVTARACTPRRRPDSFRSLPASPPPMRCPLTPTWCWTPPR
jgi:hypothetical protein